MVYHSQQTQNLRKKKMAEKAILLDFFASMFGMRARVALAAKGVEYEYKEEDFTTKAHFFFNPTPFTRKSPF